MSDHAGQDNGTLRVTIREAATRLDVSEAPVRKRIQRGSLDKEIGRDGRVYVYLDLSRDTSHPKSQVYRDPTVEELVVDLRDRVAFLERSPERWSVEAERYQQVVVGLTQANNLSARVLELEGPAETPARPQASEEPAQDAANGAGGPRLPPAGDAGAQNGSERVSWWRRVFGG